MELSDNLFTFKTEKTVPADNNMISEINIKCCQSLDKLVCEVNVFLRRVQSA